MAKILKNQTASIISLDIGIDVPASGQVTIAAQDYDDASDSDDIVEKVGSGDLIVNDGSFDLTKADGMRLIQGGFSNKIQLDEDLLSSDRIKIDVIGTLSDGAVKVSINDSTCGYLEDKILSPDNKILISTLNDGSDEDLQIELQSVNINTGDLNNDANFIDSAGAPVQPSDLVDFETSSELDIRDTDNRNRDNHTGTQLASTILDFNSAVTVAETTTNLSFNNTTKVLTYVNEDAVSVDVDLTQFLDDTNLARVVSGTLDGITGIATFTRDDSTTFTIDMSSLNDQAFINNAIDVHEQSIDNHDDVDITTNSPSVDSILKWDGSNYIPFSPFKDFASSTTGMINQTTSFEQYLRLSTTVPDTANYKVSWSYTWSVNSTGNDFITQVEIDDSTVIMNHQQESKDSSGTGVVLDNTTGGTSNTSTNQRYQCSGFFISNLTAGSHTIDLDWRSEVSSIEPAIYQAVISIERWE